MVSQATASPTMGQATNGTGYTAAPMVQATASPTMGQ
eukprot:gene16461-3018_t